VDRHFIASSLRNCGCLRTLQHGWTTIRVFGTGQLRPSKLFERAGDHQLRLSEPSEVRSPLGGLGVSLPSQSGRHTYANREHVAGEALATIDLAREGSR